MWWNSNWAVSNPTRWRCESAALNMPANMENLAVATGLEKMFSFQPQRQAMPKNVQTTTQLHSLHMLAKLSKSGFNSLWTKNFQMFKLQLEKAVEPEVKLPTTVASSKKQENSRKTSTSVSLTTLMPLTVWITNCGKLFKEMGIPDHFTCLLRNLYARQEATDRTGHGRKKKKESYPGSQFKSISSFALSLLYGPILISVHDYWKNHIFDNMDLC